MADPQFSLQASDSQELAVDNCQENQLSLKTLPMEIIIEICTNLRDSHLASFSQTCKKFHFVVNDAQLRIRRYYENRGRVLDKTQFLFRDSDLRKLVKARILISCHGNFLAPLPCQTILEFGRQLERSLIKNKLSRELQKRPMAKELGERHILLPGGKIAGSIARLEFNRQVYMLEQFFAHSFKRPRFHVAWRRGLIRYYNEELGSKKVGVELLAQMFESCQISKEEEPESNYYKVKSGGR